jgi:hypothetical protein
MIPVIIVSAVLVLYLILILTKAPLLYINIIFTASPFLVSWMVYCVIRYGKYKGRVLSEDEEWGYADKEKSEVL